MSRPLWTWDPNWAGGVRERIAWKTDVEAARSGAESRRRVRHRPRQMFEFDILAYGDRARTLDAKLWAHQAGEWWLPIWTDPTRLVAYRTDSNGNSTLQVDRPLAVHDFRRASWAVIYESANSFEVVKVDDIGTDADGREIITLAAAPSMGQPTGSLVLPVRVARMLPEQGVARLTAGTLTGAVTFEVTQTDRRTSTEWGYELWPPDSGGVTYDTTPVDTRTPNRARVFAVDYARGIERVDFGTGLRAYHDIIGRALTGRTHDHVLVDRADIWTMREWLSWAAGRHQSFWSPSWQADLRLVAPISSTATAIEVAIVNWATSYNNGELGRGHIAIRLKDGTVFYRQITGNNVDTTEVLHIDSELGQAVAVEDVAQISWLEHVRLASDTIEITWDTAGVARVSLPLQMLVSR